MLPWEETAGQMPSPQTGLMCLPETPISKGHKHRQHQTHKQCWGNVGRRKRWLNMKPALVRRLALCWYSSKYTRAWTRERERRWWQHVKRREIRRFFTCIIHAKPEQTQKKQCKTCCVFLGVGLLFDNEKTCIWYFCDRFCAPVRPRALDRVRVGVFFMLVCQAMCSGLPTSLFIVDFPTSLFVGLHLTNYYDMLSQLSHLRLLYHPVYNMD